MSFLASDDVLTIKVFQEGDNRIEPGQSVQEEPQTENGGHSEDEGQSECGSMAEDQEDDLELNKRLNKQRRRAIQAAHGKRKSFTSRNTYKDKGGRSSHNSKIQGQLGGW